MIQDHIDPDQEEANYTGDKAESTLDFGTASAKRTRSENNQADKSSVEPLIKKTCGAIADMSPSRGSSNSSDLWDVKQIKSKEGLSKLTTKMLFASFDQINSGAGGWGACSAIAAVTAHWLLSAGGDLPTVSQLESLVVQGSYEWLLLCRRLNIANAHLELETVTEAGIVPIDTCPRRSSVGFFGTDTIGALKDAEAMSIDNIWDGITREQQDYPGVYIVSWNDHFFVLMAAEGGVFYVVDSYGRRLSPKLTCAYIIKFDGRTVIRARGDDGRWRPLCRGGKDCCIEFIKSFLAAPAIKDIEEDSNVEKLYEMTQIDFHYVFKKPETPPPPPPSPLCSSSPSSSASSDGSSSSSSSEEEDDDDPSLGLGL